MSTPPSSASTTPPNATPSAASLRRRSQVTRVRRGTGPVSANDLPNVRSSYKSFRFAVVSHSFHVIDCAHPNISLL